MTSIYLIRHGETDWNALERCQGTLDIPLNARGVGQAEALRHALRDVAFDAAYTSPLTRARQTAACVLRDTGVRPVAVPELHEMSYGTYQGLAPNDWRAGDAAQWELDPWSVTFPDGESLADVHRRATPLLDRIVGAHRGETVLISGHGHLNRVLMLHALAERVDFWSIAQPNGGGHVLRYSGVDSLNRPAATPLIVDGTFTDIRP
ncbi:MAG: cobT [Gemmatimonadetes bacterium]|nr:cobT [Gemmatimonadota bacterium]